MKEEVVEQIVDDDLQQGGDFARHNLRFRASAISATIRCRPGTWPDGLGEHVEQKVQEEQISPRSAPR